ncbi:Uncharacterised protein [Chlamydia trachomatis]|nr:Uncharacterised protein [Chlamydia trachomatis]
MGGEAGREPDFNASVFRVQKLLNLIFGIFNRLYRRFGMNQENFTNWG